MDDIIVRSRYPRQNIRSRRHTRYGMEKSNIPKLIVRQLFVCIILFLLVYAVKSINTPFTNYISDRIKYVFSENIETDMVFGYIDTIVKKLRGDKEASKAMKDIPDAEGKNGKNMNPLSAKDSSTESAEDSDAGIAKSLNTDNLEDPNMGNAENSNTGIAKNSSTDIADNNTENTEKFDSESESMSDAVNVIPNETREEEYKNNLPDTTVNSGSISRGALDIMIAPVSGVLSSSFGKRKDPISGLQKFHEGIDIKAAMGSSIFAVLDGVVLESGNSYTYGKYIKLKHAGGLVTVYAHCSAIIAVEKKRVKQGDLIARVGNTGASVGAHLHFEILSDDKPLNPLDFVDIPEEG